MGNDRYELDKKAPSWFHHWIINDFAHLKEKVSRIEEKTSRTSKLQTVIIAIALSVLAMGVAIFVQYVFR
jgi:hypothetical protein